MDRKGLAGLIDQTMLNPAATEAEITAFIAASMPHGFRTLCVPPCRVPLASSMLKGSPTGVSTVAGFPLGFEAPGTKLLQARRAVDDGAEEVDVVMNISHIRSGDLRLASDELSGIVAALPGTRIKAIIEACYLTGAEKLSALEAAAGSGAAFVKTSTGFGPSGATVEDVRLLFRASAGRLGVKASGGIKTLDDALSMVRAGATRIGTSSGIKILEGLKA